MIYCLIAGVVVAGLLVLSLLGHNGEHGPKLMSDGEADARGLNPYTGKPQIVNGEPLDLEWRYPDQAASGSPCCPHAVHGGKKG